MQVALETYLRRVESGAEHVDAVVAAARALRLRPWDVVRYAGLLARCRPSIAREPFGLTSTLRRVPSDSRAAIARIAAGQRYPELLDVARRARSTVDPPIDWARQIVQTALKQVDGEARVALDPACGVGAFLVALTEAGVAEVYGTELDPVALAVARIAAPTARLVQLDGLKHGPEVDLVCGAPPFVPPSMQDAEARRAWRLRSPWLGPRVDLALPFAAAALERVRPGGAAGLVLPTFALVDPAGAPVRRRWLARHRIIELHGPVTAPGATTDQTLFVAQIGTGPGLLPRFGLSAEEAAALPVAALDPSLMPGDALLLRSVRAASVALGEVAFIDAGLVLQGPDGAPSTLVHDSPGGARVPFVDAEGLAAGVRRWLDYTPAKMHRPRRRSVFERDKLLLSRPQGRGQVRAAIDRDQTFVDRTLTMVSPRDARVTLEQLLELVTSPWLDVLTRIEAGRSRTPSPDVVASWPFPRRWLTGPPCSLAEAWGLDEVTAQRLSARASR